METSELLQFVKDQKGSGPWTVTSLIHVAVPLLMKIQMYTNLTKDQKKKLVCNLIKKVLLEEKAELDKKLDLTTDQKKVETAVFEKLEVAVDEVLPAVLNHIPIPELPKAITRWFSFMPCSMASVGLFASEHLVSLADDVKKVEAVSASVVVAVPAVEKVLEKVTEAVTVAETVAATVAATEAVAVTTLAPGAITFVLNTPVTTTDPTTVAPTQENKV